MFVRLFVRLFVCVSVCLFVFLLVFWFVGVWSLGLLFEEVLFEGSFEFLVVAYFSDVCWYRVPCFGVAFGGV